MKKISVNNTFQNTSTAIRTVKEVITIESDSSESAISVSYKNQNENDRTFSYNHNVFRTILI